MITANASELRKTGVDVSAIFLGVRTFACFTTRRRICSKHRSATARLDCKARSSAYG